MAINCYYIDNNSFHGLQISNLNTQSHFPLLAYGLGGVISCRHNYTINVCVDNVCVNHVMYADDICLMTSSPAALQKLINICYDFSVQNKLSFNSSKLFCMVFN